MYQVDETIVNRVMTAMNTTVDGIPGNGPYVWGKKLWAAFERAAKNDDRRAVPYELLMICLEAGGRELKTMKKLGPLYMEYMKIAEAQNDGLH